MKNKILITSVTTAIIIVFSIIFLTSCTENIRTKQWGGTATITLPAGQKLIKTQIFGI